MLGLFSRFPVKYTGAVASRAVLVFELGFLVGRRPKSSMSVSYVCLCCLCCVLGCFCSVRFGSLVFLGFGNGSIIYACRDSRFGCFFDQALLLH